MTSGLDTTEVTTLLTEVAAAVIMPRFAALSDSQVFEKQPGDLVTVADREAEVLITERLLAAYPHAVVLGEEAFAADPSVMDRYLHAEHAFTVDPVDGTKNFVRGEDGFAVMLAEVRRGELVRSWIFRPRDGRTYVAEQGAGAYRDGERLRCTPPADLEALRGATSRKRWLGASLGGLAPTHVSWRCCGVDFPKIIEGAVDYLVWGTATPWDHAPGALLLREAGGEIGWPDGSRYTPQVRHVGAVVAAASAEALARVVPHL